MTIGEQLINEIKSINDNNLNGYVNIPIDYYDEEEDIIKYVTDELIYDEFVLKTITIKDIETYNFTVEINGDNDYDYYVDLYYNKKSDDYYLDIKRVLKTINI
jgi:hypothetical protein